LACTRRSPQRSTPCDERLGAIQREAREPDVAKAARWLAIVLHAVGFDGSGWRSQSAEDVARPKHEQ
jgi:hypothetical protein